MSTPRVSAVTIFFEAERFLEEAIESVLAQTFADWELILVDDGSTDGGSAIAQRYAEAEPRIRVVTHPERANRGMSASRNLGAAEATGDLVAFLDADDTWFPSKLEEQVALADAHPEVGMIYGRTGWWYGWTGKPADLARDYVNDPGVPFDTVIDASTLVESLVTDGLVLPYTCSTMVRREVYERLGGFEEPFRGLYEDQVFFAKVFLSESIYVADRLWDRYRQHDQSACAVAYAALETHPVDINPARGAFLEWLLSYLGQEWPGDRRLWEVVSEALRPYRYPTAWWEITEVQQAAPNARLRGSYIDAPIAGKRTGGDAVHVLGWAVGADAPVIAVELVHAGHVVACEPTTYRRPDLVGAFPDVEGPDESGFRVRTTPVGMTELDIEVLAVLRDHDRVAIGRIRGRRCLREQDHAVATPLVSIVITVGRDSEGLAETIESALDQSYSYTETVVVDSGLSVDQRRLLASYAGLRVIESTDEEADGMGAKAGTGSLVAFAESGQRLERSAIGTAVARLLAHPDRWASSGEDMYAEPAGGAVAMFHRYAVAGRAPENGDRARTMPSRLRVSERTTSAVVLLYHRVADLPADPWGLAVSSTHFPQHLDVLRETGTPISLAELVSSLGSARLPRRAVAVTFDDGYRDNLEVAAPLLERFGIPATVFVTTGVIGKDQELWWDQLEGILLAPGELPEEVELEIDGASRRWTLDGAAAFSDEAAAAHRAWRAWQEPPTKRHALFADLYQQLRPLEPAARSATLQRLRELSGRAATPRPANLPLSERQLLDLADSRSVSIGAHTVRHACLTDVSVLDQRYEIEESKRRLEELLDRPVTMFSYPHGSYTTDTRDVVAQAGFHAACAADGRAVPAFADRFALPRVPVDDWTGEELARRLDFWFSS